MRRFYSTIVFVICVLSVAVATAQDRAATKASEGQAAIDRAAAANKYAFIFFWKAKGPQTDKVWGIVQPAMAKMADKADVVSIQITDAAEKKIVAKYDVSRAPMPMLLAVAPSGAITKAFTKAFDDKELRTAFVSPCTERCMKAIQSGKVVFVCVVNQTNPQDKVTVPKGVEDFQADKKYGARTEIVVLNVRDAGEAAFLKDLEVGKNSAPLTVFLAPGALVGKFGSEATKDELIAKFVEAQEACGPGCNCH